MEENDILKSIKAALYDRSSSPLAGTFLIALLVWNYRVIFILFSGDHYAANFYAIDQILSSDFFDNETGNWWIGRTINLFLIPAGLTWFYIVGYPKIAIPVYEYVLKNRNKLRIAKAKAEGARQLTVKESNEIQKRLAQLNASNERNMGDYAAQVEALNTIIEERDEEIVELRRKSDYWDDGHGDEADVEEYDAHIESQIESLQSGVQFTVPKLFGGAIWREKSRPTQLGVQNRLYRRVQRGDFPLVTVLGGDLESSDGPTYEKIVSPPLPPGDSASPPDDLIHESTSQVTDNSRKGGLLSEAKDLLDPDLNELEIKVLLAATQDSMGQLANDNSINKGQYQLAISRLRELGLLDHGPSGYYVLRPGLEWLNRHGHLED